MCKQTDRQTPSVPRTHSSQPRKEHACAFTRTDTDTPIITSLQDNSTQRRLPRLHHGGCATPLSLCLLVALLAGGGHSSHNSCYASDDNRALSEGRRVQTRDFLFWKLIDWWLLLTTSLSVSLTADVNGWCWKLTCARTQDPNWWLLAVTGCVRLQLEAFVWLDVIIRYKSEPCHIKKYLVRMSVTYCVVLELLFSWYLLLSMDSVCMCHYYTPFFNWVCFNCTIFYFPVTWPSVFPSVWPLTSSMTPKEVIPLLFLCTLPLSHRVATFYCPH